MVRYIAEHGDIEAEMAGQVQSSRSGESTVMELVVDDSGDIIFESPGSDSEKSNVSGDLIRRVLSKKASNGTAGRYIFTKRKLRAGKTLIVMDNAALYRLEKKQLMSTAVLSAGEAVLIAPATYTLFRIIARPARRSTRRGRQWILDTGHGLKTSLSVLGLNAQAIEAEAGQNDHVDTILSETQNMNHMVERMMELSELDEKKKRNETEFSLSDIVTENVLAFESAAVDKNLDYQSRVKEEIRMKGDEDEIRQLVAILIDNAVKYADKNGAVSVQLTREKNKSCLEVVNSGAGISRDELSHVFERFYRKGQGSDVSSYGLGLAIAAKIVENHGGKITADSQPGIYTCFRVIL